MRFTTRPQKDCYTRIVPWMRAIFGDVLDLPPEQAQIGVMVGSAYVVTQVRPLEPDQAVIVSRAYLATDIEVYAGLPEHLLRLNDRILFGAFGMDENGAIFIQHSIIGTPCDPAQLEASLMAVALLADHFDDEIVTRWGGRRAIDRTPGELSPPSVRGGPR